MEIQNVIFLDKHSLLIYNTYMKKTIELTCKVCGKKFNKALSQYRADLKKCNAGKFCSLSCLYKSDERKANLGKMGKNSSGWKGGRIYERGYRLVVANDHPNGILKGSGKKYIREHRLIIEKYIGRYLTKDEHVHHINGDIQDNRIENLQLMTASEHNSYHMKKSWSEGKFDKCKEDGNCTQTFTR
jgi:hypothetical protein